MVLLVEARVVNDHCRGSVGLCQKQRGGLIAEIIGYINVSISLCRII